MKYRLCCFFALVVALFAFSPISAQHIFLNEVLSNNTLSVDEYGQNSDWIELYNASNQAINLQNYQLTDDLTVVEKWQFGNVLIGPLQHLLVYASGVNKKEFLSYKTIINKGDVWKYSVANVSIPDSWKELTYNDGAWPTGPSGFGYGDNDDNTLIPSGSSAVLLRYHFSVADVSALKEILLHMDYDDAFVAYINGTEVARANIGVKGQKVGFSDVAIIDHEAKMYSGGQAEAFVIPFEENLILQGDNVLCIQGHNINANSSDLTFIPFLTLGFNDGSPSNLSPLLNLEKSFIHTDFKVSDTEAVYLLDASSNLLDSLRVMAAPANVSTGRKSDGHSEVVLFENPTPGATNSGPFYLGINTDELVFSRQAGKYDQAFVLNINGSEEIRYTVDGTVPTSNSPKYSSPIPINKNTFVRAISIKKDFLPGKVFDKNYLVGIKHKLPIVSLYTDPKLLFDQNVGMYVLGTSYNNSIPYEGANFWEDWEYPFNFQYYDLDGKLQTDATAGVKIFGGWSRANEQRSFSLFARSVYGTKNFNYNYFKERNYQKFESLVLRNSGNDWMRSMMRDAVMTGILANTTLDFQAYSPVVSYLNGQYWGIYNMREKVDEHFLSSRHNVSTDSIDLLESDGSLIHGDAQSYNELKNFIQQNSLAGNANYNKAIAQIDETNFIQYQAAEIYYNNTDWPGNNIKFWKEKSGKWKWILFDTDFGLGIYNANDYTMNSLEFALATNGPNWPNPPWSTLFLRKLLENNQFKVKFVNYFADMINTVFLPTSAQNYIDSLANNIQNEIPAHYNRWSTNINNWQSNLTVMKNYFVQRPAYMRNFIRQRFGLPAQYVLTLAIDSPVKGNVQLNSLKIDVANWSGIYFQNNPVTLSAIPKPGYKFLRWTGAVESTDNAITVNMDQAKKINALFISDDETVGAIVINEINYNSSKNFDADDWVELYNRSNSAIDVSNWILKDDDDSHAYKLPQNTIMQGNTYMVLSSDVSKFKEVFTNVSSVHGDLGFKFSSSGDMVRLYDNAGTLQDSVAFTSKSPWAVEANGEGPTLELLGPFLENSIPESWSTFLGNGTPGQKNNVLTSIEEVNNFEIQIYPNPTAAEVWISNQNLKIEKTIVCDVTGKVLSQINGQVEMIDLTRFKSGIYNIKFLIADGTVITKMVVKI